jgi:tetrathionate reductase subunit B
LQPACVETCPTGALIFGNIRDPNSQISKVLSTNRVVVLKQIMATYPHVFYINLDMDVADPLMGYEECVSCYEVR